MKFAISQPKVVRLPNISIELQASKVTKGLALVMTLAFEFSRSKVKLTFDHTRPWARIFMVKFLNSCISEWEGWLTLNKGVGSKPFMTMTMAIWWPRSDVRIYQIMLSAHLVYFCVTKILVNVDKNSWVIYIKTIYIYIDRYILLKCWNKFQWITLLCYTHKACLFRHNII